MLRLHKRTCYFLIMDDYWYEMPGGNVVYRSALCKIVQKRQNWIKINHPDLGHVLIALKDRMVNP